MKVARVLELGGYFWFVMVAVLGPLVCNLLKAGCTCEVRDLFPLLIYLLCQAPMQTLNISHFPDGCIGSYTQVSPNNPAKGI